ncbi:hypothetical protein ND747_14360, partial [Frankia sp. R82]|nr:hypothetical protein [Frankia sp. R82]
MTGRVRFRRIGAAGAVSAVAGTDGSRPASGVRRRGTLLVVALAVVLVNGAAVVLVQGGRPIDGTGGSGDFGGPHRPGPDGHPALPGRGVAVLDRHRS